MMNTTNQMISSELLRNYSILQEIVKTMDSKHKVFLGESCNTKVPISHEITSRKLMYPISGADVKAFPNSTIDDMTVSAISDTLKHSTEQPTETGLSIAFLVKWPHPRIEHPRVSVVINIDEKLSTELADIFSQPKLSIVGIYEVYGLPRSLEPLKFQISDIEMSSSTQSIENFTGALKMQELVTESARTSNWFSINLVYSIILEGKPIDIKSKRVKVLDRLYNERLFADCSIITSNLNHVVCHRNVLSATSDVLHAMLTSGMEESQTNQIPMKHVSEEAVNALLKFIYEQEMKMESLNTETVIELFKTAHEYNIQALEDQVKEFLHKKRDECFKLCAALDLYLFAVNVEGCDRICKKMLQIFKRNPTKLRSSPAFQDLSQSDHMKTEDLLFKLLELQNKD